MPLFRPNLSTHYNPVADTPSIPANAGQSFYENFTASGVGSPADTEYNPSNPYDCFCALSPTRVLVMEHNSGEARVELFGISGSTVTSLDSEQVLAADGNNYYVIAGINSTQAIMCYTDTNGSDFARIVDITGDNISLGSEVEFETSATNQIRNMAITVLTSSLAVVLFRDADNGYPQYQELDISGMTVSANTSVVVDSNNVNNLRSGMSRIDSDTVLIGFIDVSDADFRISAVTVPSTIESKQLIYSQSAQNLSFVAGNSNGVFTWNPDMTAAIIAMSKTGSGDVFGLYAGSVSGTTTTLGSRYEPPNGTSSSNPENWNSHGGVVLFGNSYGIFSSRNGTSSDYVVDAVPFYISGTTITYGTPVEIVDSGNSGKRPKAAKILENNKAVILCQNSDNSSGGLYVLTDT